MNFKYNEDNLLDDVHEYIKKTYGEHYVGNKQIQTLDVWESMGIAEEMCLGTIVKYAMRYGKKEGKNKKIIKINPIMNIQTEETILLDYKILSFESQEE